MGRAGHSFSKKCGQCLVRALQTDTFSLERERGIVLAGENDVFTRSVVTCLKSKALFPQSNPSAGIGRLPYEGQCPVARVAGSISIEPRLHGCVDGGGLGGEGAPGQKRR